jgi:hypothetical protein
MKSRKRLALRLGFVAAVACASFGIAGYTFARLSASTPTRSGTVTAGTVTLSSVATTTCNVSNLLPGGSAGPCTLAATYSGSSPAYLGLDVVVATKAGSGGAPLYDPTDSSADLQITISDNQSSPVTYVNGSTSFGSAVACPGGFSISSGSTCYAVSDLLVSTTAFTSSSPTDTFSTTVSLPTTSPSGAQGSEAQVVLLVHAAQSHNQSLTGCAAGQACTSVSWS